MMVLVPCLNPALDITYATPRLTIDATHRVTVSGARAGGKGVNVARVLGEFEAEAIVIASLGGATGEQVRQDLERSGIAHLVASRHGETRRTITVLEDSGTATVLTERGEPLDDAEWGELRRVSAQRMPGASVCVLSGSLPPGAPPESYALLVSDATASGTASIVDTEGEALMLAAEAGASMLKPNIHELRATLGTSDAIAGARSLLERGAGAVVVSLGADGVAAVDREGAWRARLPHPLLGNPTGAGDALVAALARGLHRDALPDLLRDAVALSAAAVLHPLAGGFDANAYPVLRTAVTLERAS